MVAHDHEFKIDLTKLSEDELMTRRHKFYSGLYDGEHGSRDNVEKQSLIDAIDRELDRRHAKGENKRANAALVISIIALAVSVGGFILSIWQTLLSNPLK